MAARMNAARNFMTQTFDERVGAVAEVYNYYLYRRANACYALRCRIGNEARQRA